MTPLEQHLLRERIARILAGMIPSIFTAEMKLTLVARHPAIEECYVVVTNDEDMWAVAAKVLAEPSR